MPRRHRSIGLCLILVPGIALVAGADAPPRGYVAGRTATPIRVDGKLDDPAWADAPWTDDFVDVEGDRKPRPRFRTRAKMLWDDQFFYVAAEMEEPHVWGKLTEHDSVIFQDNDFEVFIDPDGDHHEYFELEMNARDTEWDLYLPRPYRDGGTADNGWEIPGLKAKSHVDGTLNDPNDRDRGWSVELAIPWAAMADRARTQAPPRVGDRWRVNFSRVEWQHEVVDGGYRKVAGTKEDNWVWSPQGTINMHRPERWGFVQFAGGKPDAASFRPDPSVATRDVLMQVYEAEVAFHGKNKRWAASLAELGLPDLRSPDGSRRPTIRLDDRGYAASLPGPAPDGKPTVWTVREDSRMVATGP